jgi:hypothetical protein
VGLDGLLGEDEPICDLGVEEALSDQIQDLDLARCEVGEARGGLRTCGGAVREFADQPAGDAGCEQRVAGRDDAHGGVSRVLNALGLRDRTQAVVTAYETDSSYQVPHAAIKHRHTSTPGTRRPAKPAVLLSGDRRVLRGS